MTYEFTVVFIGTIGFLITLILVVLLFGTFLFIFTAVYDFKYKTDASDTHYWLRSFGVALSAAFIFILFEFLFGLLMFSPVFYQEIPVDLMNAVLSTNINDMIASIVKSPTPVLILLFSMIFIIIIIMSYIMLGVYHVNYGWTTLLTWSSIASYFFFDIIISNFIFSGGIAGLISQVGNGVRDSLYGVFLS